MSKYRAMPAIVLEQRKWPSQVITQAPQWCSVDLRDGNQALPRPLNIDEKKSLFARLCDIGFKEIEVGYPAASQTEYGFVRDLIEDRLIPDDVTIQVLTQARKDLIERTVESLRGVKRVVLHFYNSTSEQQRRLTFAKDVAAIKRIALEGCQAVIDNLARLEGSEVILEYTPESFSGTELPVALDICEGVVNLWEPQKRGKVIINLPATVEHASPNHYADQIEYFIDNFSARKDCIISLHTHNDRGCAIAAAELGLLAGADRVEGTLLGNGERTGNTDLLVMALNLTSQGIASGLCFDALDKLVEYYTNITDLPISPRHPYAGELVFTAFSGSHQDAIKKGMDARTHLLAELKAIHAKVIEYKLQNFHSTSSSETEKQQGLDNLVSQAKNILEKFWQDERAQQAFDSFLEASKRLQGYEYLRAHLPWDVPYLPIDPHDLARNYDKVVRVNSQSGKGGVAYVLKRYFGLEIPKLMQPELGRLVSSLSDRQRRELQPHEIHAVLEEHFISQTHPYTFIAYSCEHDTLATHCSVTLEDASNMLLEKCVIKASGNGPLDAFLQGLQEYVEIKLRIEDYHEQALKTGSDSAALSYIHLRAGSSSCWGVGRDTDTTAASFKAVLSALNKLTHMNKLTQGTTLPQEKTMESYTSLEKPFKNI